MPFSVTCPGCESVYPVGESLVGKTIRCKKCGELITVSAPATRPAAKAATAAVRPKPAVVADDDDDDDAPPAKPVKRPARAVAEVDDEDEGEDDDDPRSGGKKRGLPLPLLIGVAAAVLIGVGGVAAFMLSGDDTPDVVQNTTPPANTGRPAEPPTPPAPPPEATKPAPTPAPTTPPAATKGEQPPPKEQPVVDKTGTRPNPVSVPPAVPTPPVNPTSSRVTQDQLMSGTMNRLTLERVKQAAVLIKAETDLGMGTGSGWFGVEPGLIFTNAHVLMMKSPGSKEPRKLTVYLNSGTEEQREIPHTRLKILAVDRDIDLALVQVIGEQNLPPPLAVKPSAELVQGQRMHTLGFPFGYTTRMAGGGTKREPVVSVRPTTFTAAIPNEYGEVRRIQIEGGVYTGNSGGAVVDAEGAVVGVPVEVILDKLGGGQTQLGLAVPTEYVTGLLAGRIADVEYKTPYRENGKVHIPVKVNCLDPLKRLNKVGIAGWVGDSSDKHRKPGMEKPTRRPSDSDYQLGALKYDEAAKVATGELVLPELAPGRAYWVQPYYSNSNTPEYWLPGIKAPVSGPPVDRTPAELVVRFRTGAARAVTMSNSSDLNEHIEGEGEGKNERVTLRPTLKLTETVYPGAQQFAARLNLQFQEFGLAVERGAIVDDEIIPKQLLQLINENAKLASAVGHVTKSGEMVKYELNTLAIQEPRAKFLVTVLGQNALESLNACSIPLPNARMNAGQTWKTTKNFRLSLVSTKVGKDGKPANQAREFKYVNHVTYTYVGQRERAGKREAVVTIEGKVSQAPGTKETATGELKGTALVELDGGTVVEAELENELELDTSGDGLKKRLSAINKYKLSRGPSAQ